MAVGSDKVSFLVDQIASRCGEWRDLFAAIGLTVVAGVTVKLALNFGKTLWIHYGGTLKQQKIKLLKYGQWASKLIRRVHYRYFISRPHEL